MEIVSQNFFIPKLPELACTIVTHCVRCILASQNTGKREIILHSIPKGDKSRDKGDKSRDTYHCAFFTIISLN